MITVKAYAKLNLTLDVVGVREDGYHLLESVMQSVSLCDIVRIKTDGSGEISVATSNEVIADDKTNIAYRAAESFFERTGAKNPGIAIDIEKRIPVGAGMAGGSADGAAVIVALDKLLGTHLAEDELCSIGDTVGADVPFCIVGGTMFAEGTGNILTPLPNLPECYIAIAKPAQGVSTGAAYRAVDEYTGEFVHPDADELLEVYRSGDIEGIARRVCNLFEPAIALPKSLSIRDEMLAHGALGACMTGSGSAVFGIFRDRTKATLCCERLSKDYDDVFLTLPTTRGCEIID
ncbi:MAG: 4-(cytidine 5'-diphospho)-2-C-methyl-D-erythritol kinase [Clostridia bacterium]|nr:4-(cytidine 5'-diphospho)-2-C-methyl-D-erythritol kinase [Clostridia bacterium]